jgi:RimJ/RimL family protein N-acetyltransferase
MSHVIEFQCLPDAFQPAQCSGVRWLSVTDDEELLARHFVEQGVEPNTRDGRAEIEAEGYHYAGYVEGDDLLCMAGYWIYSESAWGLVAVGTLERARRRGLATAVCSFITRHVLDAGIQATTSTMSHNVAMIGVAERLGYRRA